jgi:hypothetical protein
MQIRKLHTTNYTNAFIETADDCPATTGIVPPDKTPKTTAQAEFEMMIGNPYRYTSDDVIYTTKGKTKGISRDDFFLKGQPCLRTSSLTKRYGWGVHCNGEGRVALYAVDSDEYRGFANDTSIKHVKAMSQSRKGK